MLSKEERKELNMAFWNGFRVYMYKVRSSNGRKMNWLNYPTDVRDLYLRLQVDSKGVRMCFDIQPKDQGVREIVWEQMTELKKVLSDAMNQDGEWIENHHAEDGRVISRICWEKVGLNFYNTEDHQAIFEFFKARLTEFDEFYQEFKEILISLIK